MPLVFKLRPLVSALALAYSCTTLASDTFSSLGFLAGESDSQTYAMSANGSAIVGSSGSSAFLWTSAGMTNLGPGIPSGVSTDGSAVALSNGGPFRWTQASGAVYLGSFGGGGAAWGISADGHTVVGDSWDPWGNWYHAFRWTQATGLVDLGTIGGGDISSAWGASADGSVVVGYAFDSNMLIHAFRWTQASGMVDLGTIGNTGDNSRAYGVSADGSVVVGEANSAPGNPVVAFRWTQAGGMLGLGTLGGDTSTAYAVSGNGLVVVGTSSTATPSQNLAFRWTQGRGMQSVSLWLSDAGVNVPVGWVLTDAKGTNADGTVVAGTGTNASNQTEAWIARVGPVGSGLVTVSDIQRSTMTAARASNMALTGAMTVLNGAHSRPLDHRVDEGKRAFWISGDWGQDDHGQRSGNFGFAEVGGGLNAGMTQFNVSLGQSWATQGFDNSSQVKSNGNYLMGEALVPLGGTHKHAGLWGTLSAYVHRGNADMLRGYMNSGAVDVSSAQPKTQTWGWRARLDWENAAHLGHASVTPYIDLSRSQARIDGYTETGGGFPARFNERQENATELRLGTNITRPLLSGNARLLATSEVVHRFEATGTRTQGEIIGLFGFDLPGQGLKRDWVRLGIGVEGKLGDGVASVMINGTSQGEAPNAWLAASYKVAF